MHVPHRGFVLGTRYLEVLGVRGISLARIVGPVGIGVSGADTRSIALTFVLVTSLPTHRHHPFWHLFREHQKQNSATGVLCQFPYLGLTSFHVGTGWAILSCLVREQE